MISRVDCYSWPMESLVEVAAQLATVYSIVGETMIRRDGQLCSVWTFAATIKQHTVVTKMTVL